MKKVVHTLYTITGRPHQPISPVLYFSIFLLLITTAMLPSRAFGRTEGFAHLVSLVHDYGCGGSIEYELTGNASDYTYYWKHGPTTLLITGLTPGIYTLVVRDQSGCEQEFTSIVLDRSDCAAQISYSPGPTLCDVYVTVTPLDVNPATALPPGYSAQISWSDGVFGVYTRLLSKAMVEGGALTFTYSQLYEEQVCCTTTGLIVPNEGWEEAPVGGCAGDCSYEVTIEETAKKCERLITIIPDPALLAAMDEAAFVVMWSDGLVSNSLQRRINLYTTYGHDLILHAQVSIFELYSCTKTCEFTLTVEIKGSEECGLAPDPDPIEQRVVVNEFGTTGGEASSQYIELLVTGGGECGGHTDLRGIIVDDNNGQLIPPGEFVHQYNRHLIGINEGFIYFAWNEAWAEIPNGSLIVLYNQRDSSGILPADDPFDANEDRVYVLSYTDVSLFRSKTSWWDASQHVEQYEGVLDEPVGNKILVTGPADGIQVRLPSGDYMHGLSTGVSPLALPVNPFSLWLGELPANAAVCRMTGSAPYDWEAFQCTLYDPSVVSPGLPNSGDNAALILKLTACDEELLTGAQEEERTLTEITSVQVTIDADVSAYDLAGQLITYTITVTNTGNTVLTGLEVSDDATGFFQIIRVLLPCETRTFTSTYVVDCKWLANEAGITNTITVAGQASATDYVHLSNNSISLAIEKTSSSSFAEGAMIVHFSLKLINYSPNAATGVSVMDYLPDDGYSGVLNISNGGAVVSSGGSTTHIGWENLSVPANNHLILSFDAPVSAQGTIFENCAEITGSDQYNIKAPPCNDETDKGGISSCDQPDVCQLIASIVDIDYQDNGTPLDPSDDLVFFEILVSKPYDIPGTMWNIFGSPAGNFSGSFDVPQTIGPFSVGFEAEWLTIELKESTPCKTALLISSPAALGDYVWYDTDLDGLQDAGEAGIAGIEVVLKQGGATVATTTTSSTGYYLFTNLAPGEYTIWINPGTSTSWETVTSLDFQVAQIGAITEISGNNGFVLSGNGATGLSTDKCVRSALLGSNSYLSLQQTLSDDYQYRIRWNVKNSSGDPSQQKIIQLRYNTGAAYTGTDIGPPYTLPQIAAASAGAEYTGAVFGGLSGAYHLILASAPGSSTANVNCYFDNFRLERRQPLWVPTTQNVGGNEGADSDINASGVSEAVTLQAGDIYMDMDAGFVPGTELLGDHLPENLLTGSSGSSAQDALLVYPNPFSTENCHLQLASSLEGGALISLYTPLSQRIVEAQASLVSGSNDVELQMPPGLPAGVYLVKVQFPSGKILSQIITKIRL